MQLYCLKQKQKASTNRHCEQYKVNKEKRRRQNACLYSNEFENQIDKH